MGGPLASFKVNFTLPRSNIYVFLCGGGGGDKLFSKGVESNCLSIELVIEFTVESLSLLYLLVKS